MQAEWAPLARESSERESPAAGICGHHSTVCHWASACGGAVSGEGANGISHVGAAGIT